MNHKITIKKGLDLKLAGGLPAGYAVKPSSPPSVAVTPDDFPGFLPKPEVKEGDEVAAGQPVLFDKRDNDIKIVAPAAGKVRAIVRGDRRKILRVVIDTESNGPHTDVTLKEASREGVVSFLKRSGLWAMMRQRPYDIVPDGAIIPRDIFVTAIDSAPLAADMTQFVASDTEALARGVGLLATLTPGKVYISRRSGSQLPDIAGAEMIDIEGPHPAGNVGVQIANISPVNKGESVLTLDITTLWRIGRTAIDGAIPMTAWVALTGSEIVNPHVVATTIGADLKSIVGGSLKDDGRHHRIISGNVLTGVAESIDGYLRYPYRQVTVIPEGDDVNEFMGWASLSPSKMSQSRSFPGRFMRRIFSPDARLNGSHRAFIMSGEYDRYMPMDIMAEYLLKAIIGRDIDRMEQLGIYEVAPEDFALGEYADTSKLEAQRIVREGLDYLRKELE